MRPAMLAMSTVDVAVACTPPIPLIGVQVYFVRGLGIDLIGQAGQEEIQSLTPAAEGLSGDIPCGNCPRLCGWCLRRAGVPALDPRRGLDEADQARLCGAGS